jgi:hypothetical protein
MYANLIILATLVSLTQKCETTRYFFFKILEGTVVFKTTDILSLNIDAGLANATPNDRSMYLTSTMSLLAILEGTNPDP